MKVGFNKTDITPDYPVHMAGYNRKLKSRGVLSSIEINSLVIEIQGEVLVISILDSIILDSKFCEDVKQDIYNEFNIQKKNIIISCIHTHSAPAYFGLQFEDTIIEKNLQVATKKEMISSINKAFQNVLNCSITYKESSIDGLYGNRNTREGLSDKSINILEFSSNQKILCSLLNISVHPTILNKDNLLLSSDLLGAVRSKYSLLSNAPAMICNGIAGDVSTRFYRKGKGVDELEYVSTQIIKQISEKVMNVDVVFNCITSKWVEYLTHSDFSKDDVTIHSINSDTNDFLKERSKLKLSFGQFDLLLTSSIIRLGDVFIISLPGDVVSYFGKIIKESLYTHKVIFICYSGGYCNYLVNSQQYGKYFETFTSRCLKGEADIFINKVIETAKSLL